MWLMCITDHWFICCSENILIHAHFAHNNNVFMIQIETDTFFVDLKTCFGQKLKCCLWKAASHCHRYVFNVLLVHLSNDTYEHHKKADSVNSFWNASKHKLGIYTPTQSLAKYTSGSIASPQLNWAVAALHHHLRHSQPSEISFQRNFLVDNWSADWTLHIPPRWFCSKACCGGNDNTSCDRNCKLNAMWLLNAATLKTAFFSCHGQNM